jgi:hypothetical protein
MKQPHLGDYHSLTISHILIASHKLIPLQNIYCFRILDYIFLSRTGFTQDELYAVMHQHQPTRTWAYHRTRVQDYLRMLRMCRYIRVSKSKKGEIRYTANHREIRRVSRLLIEISKHYDTNHPSFASPPHKAPFYPRQPQKSH